MAVQYVITERGNPRDSEAPKKFYAQAKSSGENDQKPLRFI